MIETTFLDLPQLVVAQCKTVLLDSTPWIPDSSYWILDSFQWKLYSGFQSLVGSWSPLAVA